MEELLDFEELKQLSIEQRKQIISSTDKLMHLSLADGNIRRAAQLQKIVLEAAEKCLEKCISSHHSMLTRKERDCLRNCTEPFREECEQLKKLQNYKEE